MLGSLRGQLFVGVSLAFLLLLTGIETFHIVAARRIMQEQLESHAQDAATSLGLSLGALLARGDPTLAETVINPVFDRGYYQRIELVAVDGRVLLTKTLPDVELGVPPWFATILPLEAPTAGSLVTAGWKQIGSVRVTSHPRFAYLQLWRTTWSTFAWLAVLYGAALAAGFVFLRGVLRPLDSMGRVALAIGNRDFSAMVESPRVQELRHIAATINSLSVKVKHAIDTESEKAELLRRDAYQDSVTGLLNRRGFSTQFQARLRDARDIFRGAFVLLQFHDFATFNRDAGYERGDALLESIATVIAALSNPRSGLSAHWSGAAFVIALPNVSGDEAGSFSEELGRAVHSTLTEAGHIDQVGYDIGVVTFDGDAPALGQLLSAADGAVARAAARGNALVEFGDAGSEKTVLGSSAWRARLETAIASESFELCVQPALGLPGRELIQHEVLARLVGENGERIAAADFVPMAVRHGLAPTLDKFILDRVIRQLTLAPQSGDIAVNISAVSVTDTEFLGWLKTRLIAARAVVDRLVFELSESGSDQYRESVVAFASMVRQAGARFALDNFGLHRESIQLMKALLPAYVKLSKAHTAELLDDEASRFFVASLVRLGIPLEVKVIAQGVENGDVLPILAGAGVAGYQGYLAGPITVWQA